MNAKRILCALLSLALCLGLCACSQEELESVPVQSVGLISNSTTASSLPMTSLMSWPT